MEPASPTTLPSPAEHESATIARLEIEGRRRAIDIQHLDNALKRAEHERDAYCEQLRSVNASRWTRLGKKVRAGTKIVRLSPRLAKVAGHDPKRIARALARHLRHPGQLPRLPRRLVSLVRPAAAGVAVAESRRLRSIHDADRALDVVESALRSFPKSTELLTERSAVLLALGEVTAALVNARQLLAIAPTDQHRAAEATIAGRLRELDPTWIPSLAGTSTSRPGTPSRRILHLSKMSRPYQERGYTMRSHYALQSQIAVGLEPGVVTSLGFPRLDGFAQFERFEVLDGVPHFRLDLGPDYPYRSMPVDENISEHTRQAAAVVRRFDPAMIHVNSGYRGYETALVGLALGRHFSLPVVYDVRSFHEATWTPDISRSQRGEHYELRMAKELACMREADLVFTIADTMRLDLEGRGVDADKIVVIPNAVDVDTFSPLPADRALKQALGLGDRTLLGYISNIGHREGLDFLVRAIARMLPDRPNVGGLIVGDGPELDNIRALVASLGLASAVKVIGHVQHDEIRRYYSIIDIFVIPRRDDQAARLVTPLKPFEAMAMARPLLVADLPALVEVTNPDERGLAFRAEDVEALAAKASILHDDPELRARLGRAGRDWVSRERTWKRNGDRYLDAYSRLIDVRDAADA